MNRIQTPVLITGTVNDIVFQQIAAALLRRGHRIVQLQLERNLSAELGSLRSALEGMGRLRNLNRVAGPFKALVHCVEIPSVAQIGIHDVEKLFIETVIRFGRIFQTIGQDMINRYGGKVIITATNSLVSDSDANVHDVLLAAVAGAAMFTQKLFEDNGLNCWGICPIHEINQNDLAESISNTISNVLDKISNCYNKNRILDEYGMMNILGNKIADFSSEIYIFEKIFQDIKSKNLFKSHNS
ncbi:hypothetical protein WKW50_25605 [Ochrobactrum sp. GPK 3]|uniref:hypothetical protein n=1 Tax=Brucella sp. 22210 TaxID=3453892 RepID=UPI00313850EC